MATYPLPTLAAQVSSTGISSPSYTDVLESLKASLQSIFGSDVYLEPDSQEGQFLAILALAISDSNQTMVSIYNSTSVTFAQGAGLSRLVKLNGLVRQGSSLSTADVTIVGVAGTVINNGKVRDVSGNLWDLPPIIVIPNSGTMSATVTSEVVGKISASANEINQIFTPVRGWQSVTNINAAVLGNDVESDASLRRRQNQSVSLPSKTPLASIAGAISNILGVGRYAVYENDTSVTDVRGIPGHSIAAIVEGGDDVAIATVINQKKSPGTGTYGTTSVIVPDIIPIEIDFFRPSFVDIQVNIQVKRLLGFQSPTSDSISQAVCDFINGMGIGEDLHLSWLYGAAGLSGDPTFNIPSLTFSRVGAPLDVVDVTLEIYEVASCNLSNIFVAVVW